MVVSPAPRRGEKNQKESLSPRGAAQTAKSSPNHVHAIAPGLSATFLGGQLHEVLDFDCAPRCTVKL